QVRDARGEENEAAGRQRRHHDARQLLAARGGQAKADAPGAFEADGAGAVGRRAPSYDLENVTLGWLSALHSLLSGPKLSAWIKRGNESAAPFASRCRSSAVLHRHQNLPRFQRLAAPLTPSHPLVTGARARAPMPSHPGRAPPPGPAHPGNSLATEQAGAGHGGGMRMSPKLTA